MIVVLMVGGGVFRRHNLRLRRALDWNNKAVEYLLSNRFAGADSAMQEALDLCPGHALFSAYAGLLMERTATHQIQVDSLLFGPPAFQDSSIGPAISCYQKAVRLAPFDAHWHHSLGWLHMYKGKYAHAGRFFKRTVNLEPHQAVYLCSLGLWWERQAEVDSAMYCYRRAVFCSPGILDSRFFAALLHRRPRLAGLIIDRVTEQLEKSIRDRYHPIMAAKLGRLYFFQGDTGRAAILLKRSITDLPNLNRPYYSLGLLTGDGGQREKLFRKAHFLDQRDYLPSLALGRYYHQRRRYDAAVHFYARSLKNWRLITSPHAKRLYRMYYNRFTNSFYKSIIRDDVVPNGYLAYLHPEFDWRHVRDRLAECLEYENKKWAADSLKKIEAFQLAKIDKLILR